MSNKAKVIKTCDLPVSVAAELFCLINGEKVSHSVHIALGGVLATDTEPKDLTYPEGWYYAKGALRNKHQSTTGMYGEIYLVKTDGTWWGDIAEYCTLYDN